MAPRITIVTGFLGSGKTSLLRGLLAQGAGRHLALVVNEIGQVGFDGATLRRAGDPPLVELIDGCLCCAAGSDFLVAVEELIALADPQQIIVEASGLAEPGGLMRQARAADLAIDALVAVAAADGLQSALAASPVAEWQIQAADLIVLSKVDLSDPAQIRAAEIRLREINQRAPIIRAAHGSLDPDLLFGPHLRDSDPEPAGDHLHNDGFGSILWQSDTPLSRAALTQLMSDLPAQVYRAKGVIHCGDAPWPDELHYVGGRLKLTAFRAHGPLRPLNQLVLIGTEMAA
ncbi:MAG: GTP-binding protein, partial [Oscillochloris sp.]|nr:GTP-binding protein [Oscillochloris sp.]